MDIYNVESNPPSQDGADPLDELEESAVNLAHLSDPQLIGDENDKCDKEDEIFFTLTGTAGKEGFLPLPVVRQRRSVSLICSFCFVTTSLQIFFPQFPLFSY